AIGDIHKDVHDIKKAIEASNIHPYQAGHSLTPSASSSSTPTRWWVRPQTLPTGLSTNANQALVSNYHASIAAPKKDIEVIDLSTTPNTPVLIEAPSLPTGTISPRISIDSRMSGCPAVFNKGAAPSTLADSQHADTNSKPLECGGAKAPRADFPKTNPIKSTPIGMASKVTPPKQAGKKPTSIEPAIPSPPLPAKPTLPQAPQTKMKDKEVASEADKISPKPGSEILTAGTISPPRNTDSPMKHDDPANKEGTEARAYSTPKGKSHTSNNNKRKAPKRSRSKSPYNPNLPSSNLEGSPPKMPYDFDNSVDKIKKDLSVKAAEALDYQAALVHPSRRN
ncbi:hypothetical protein BGX38DRAFT_1288543, partial [Terfezia claveryi]